jgi:uncharacterized protein with PIN domain
MKQKMILGKTPKEYMREYRKTHKESRKEYMHKWRKAHRESLSELNKNWAKNNSQREKARHVISHHKTRGFIVEISRMELEDLLERSQVCSQCGKKLQEPRLKTVDRINDAEVMNSRTVQVLCFSCNARHPRKYYAGRPVKSHVNHDYARYDNDSRI